MTPGEIKTIEPTLEGQIYGGFYTESDFSGDVHKFTYGLAGACRRLGVRMNLGRLVTGLKSAGQPSG